jgi:predicted transport protein
MVFLLVKGDIVVSAKALSEFTFAIDGVLAAVDRELGRQITPGGSETSEVDRVELTPEGRDRLATFHRKVLVLQEDWQYLKQDLLLGSASTANSEPDIERHFSNNRPLFALFQELRQAVSQTCPGVTCYANTKWICFKRERNFLIVNVLHRHLDAGIAVGENYVHSRLEKRRTKRGYGGWNGWPVEYLGLRIRSEADLDEEFKNLVQYAYENYGLLRGERG